MEQSWQRQPILRMFNSCIYDIIILSGWIKIDSYHRKNKFKLLHVILKSYEEYKEFSLITIP